MGLVGELNARQAAGKILVDSVAVGDFLIVHIYGGNRQCGFTFLHCAIAVADIFIRFGDRV